MTLGAHVVAHRGEFGVDAAIRAGFDEIVAVLGPNGAGKSTLLGALAGLVPLDAGRVVLGGAVLDDPAAGVHVPSHRRSVGLAFQDDLLFPHLSALDNAAFGLRARGMDRDGARQQARSWLERMGVADRGSARPAELSGGEAQRVALARALAPEPALVLLDEPLSRVDLPDRAPLRRLLRDHLRSVDAAALLVTHDPVEAFAVADRVLVVEAGRVVQDAVPADVVTRPRTPWVAAVAGVNLLQGHWRGAVIEVATGGHLRAAGPAGAEPAAEDGAAVLAVVHPHAVALHQARPEGTPRNVWEVTVSAVEHAGARCRVRLDGRPALVAEVTPSAVTQLGIAPGTRLWASVKATEVDVYPA